MAFLTRSDSINPFCLGEVIERYSGGEKLYRPPNPTSDDLTPFQKVLNDARKLLPKNPIGCCGLGQALTYYELKDSGIPYLHQLATLYISNASHAFLVLQQNEELFLIDVTFRQFFGGGFLAYEWESHIYDQLITYGWIKLDETVIKAYCYAALGTRSQHPLPSLESFKKPTMESLDYSAEEIEAYKKNPPAY